MAGQRTVLVEACVDSVESALAAEAGGAGRIELCDNLVEGGTTPSAATIAVACERLRIPVFVIIRPRGGDFLYSDLELEIMRRDIAQAKTLGASGVVIGALRADGTVDVERARPLVEAARPMQVTHHRAFDVTPDPFEALEAIIALGADRVLTSGQAPSALEGAEVIAAAVRQAAGRIGILPGAGIDGGNARRIVEITGAREIHVRGTALRPSAMRYRNQRVDFGGRLTAEDHVLEVTDAGLIGAIVQAVG
ncbi:MAG: copper homeostasis protein CutC [Gemmatimonadetes bacterium]|nr:copper homeostasis protein CutC [Gemmatimonadota bacterium]